MQLTYYFLLFSILQFCSVWLFMWLDFVCHVIGSILYFTRCLLSSVLLLRCVFFVKIFKRPFKMLLKMVVCTGPFFRFDFLSFILCFPAKEYSRCLYSWLRWSAFPPPGSQGVKRSSQDIFSNILIYHYDDTTITIFPLVSSGAKQSCQEIFS